MGFVAASTVIADQRDRVRDLKGGAVTLHEASLQPADGLQRMTLPDGSELYVNVRPVLTGMDVINASTEPSSTGTIMDLRLSGDAARRLTRQGDARVAVLVGGSAVSAGTITTDGRVRLTGLSSENAEKISRVVRGDANPVAGALLTVVPAGARDGLQLVDVYLQGAADLRAYQVKLTTGGGESGRLELTDVVREASRADYVFGDREVIDASSPVTGRLIATLWEGSVNTATPMYLGTYSFRPSPDAQGVFRVNVELSRETILANSANDEMAYSAGADARIMIGQPGAKDSK
jgi:hypothetical protein